MVLKSITIAVVALAIGFQAGPAAAEYGWPVKPFHEQHPIRGNFGDPRITKVSRSFHFGVDVSAARDTAVYATQDGVVTIPAGHGETVVVTASSGRVFEYWHITPSIRSGEWVRAYSTVIGHIAGTWAHVHFSERLAGRYLNPLRRGALTPYRDSVAPEFVRVRLERAGLEVAPSPLRGSVDIVASVFDAPPIKPPAPWQPARVTPALIRWRVRNASGVVRPWTTSVNFMRTLPAANLFRWIYAPLTIQNRAQRPGRYRFYVAHTWNTASLHDGKYVIQVLAADHRGNIKVLPFPITIDNN